MKKRFDYSVFPQKRAVKQYIVPILINVALLIIVLAALMMNTVDMKNQLQKNAKRYADDVSAQLADNISYRMKTRETYIRNLADTFSETPEELLTEELLNRKAEYLELEDIFVMNADGSVIPADEDHINLKGYLADHPELYTEPKIFFTSEDEVLFSAPIIRETGENSILVGTRSNAMLQKMLQDVDFQDHGLSCIVDKDGTVIVSAVDKAPFEELSDVFAESTTTEDDEEGRRVLEDINSHRSGVAQFSSVDEDPVLLGYDFLEINDWMLLTLVNADMFSEGTVVYLTGYIVVSCFLFLVTAAILFSTGWYYRRTVRHIQSVALTDPLTGGYNNLAFRLDCEMLLREQPEKLYAIIYLNIRNFKRFNERFGIKCGDELLCQIYQCLYENLGDMERLSRSSGDHFYLLLECADEESVRRRLQNMRKELERRLAGKFSFDQIQFAQGAYLIRDRDADFMLLSDRAKMASAYSRTENGCQFYDDTLGKQLEREHALDASFQQGIENHEFQLYIQPKVRPGQTDASGGEVLVRWQHPVFGLLFPGDFISLFERNGKICALDFYMFEETCRLLRTWLDEGRILSLSVNLSRAHLNADNLDFLERFREIKEQYNIPDGLIELELTESLMLERRDLCLVTTMIDRIREMGFLCSMDDFGFGYSSLTLLKDLNVSTVKLDREFFMDESEKSWLVVGQLIRLAHSLGMTVVAEGIEDQKQVEQLRLHRCDLVQGYVYAKPMPVSDFERWMGQQRREAESGGQVLDAAPGKCQAEEETELNQLNALHLTSENTYKNRLTVALKAARICIYEVDLTRQLYTFFENAEDIFGISGEEILSQVQPYSALSPEEYQKAVSCYFSHPGDAPVIAEAFENVLHGRQATYEARMRAGNSQFIWCKLDVVPILEDGRPVRMIGVITDISEARKQKEMLEQKANLDGFTGLWNKKYVISSVRKALENEPEDSHALLVMDVDDFKRFNDTHGHAEGDRLLLAISDRLGRTFHEDSIVGRFGGDEFIVFVRNIQGEKDFERLNREIESISQVEHEGLSASISIGTAFYPGDGRSFEALFERADRMLYQKKLNKGNSVSFQGAYGTESGEREYAVPFERSPYNMEELKREENRQKKNIRFEPCVGEEILTNHAAELLTALDQAFLSVVKLELDTGRAFLLHSQGRQERQPCEFDWNAYVGFYQSVLDPEEAEKVLEAFSLPKLNDLRRDGQNQYRETFACLPETGLDWLEIAVRFSDDGQKPSAYVFTRQNGDNYLLRRIIDLYVYNNCDCFICLDAKNNSYTMFGDRKSGTPLPPETSDDYSTEIVRYAEAFVVPEDQELVVREMSLDRITEELERREVHAFTCGMWAEGEGYTRKRLEYRYYNRSRQLILLSRTDITALYNEQQRHTRELENALLRAQIDPLTGLWNYQGIQDAVKKGLEYLPKKSALFFLDLDDFKQINDTYGHIAGDQALQAVADILKRNIREKDHAARIGGDEFVVFLSGISSVEAAEDCARRICGQMREVRLEQTGARLSGSIGIAIAPDDGTDYEDLVKNADSKAYRAKHNGKNQFAI